ncbi:uncharacterized protein LOC131623229 [Vicia villosa]|uniref:uncharacterized protein LOC131623229 n=1 Tax=Vicia villosa TaxID=3911 RepID=UPI00273AD770|nr:uncharacterized protein LOC131623229 [Vicia villosa]
MTLVGGETLFLMILKRTIWVKVSPNGLNATLKKGNHILFWYSCWLVEQPLRVVLPHLFERTTNKLSVVSDLFIVNNGEITWNLEDIFGVDVLNSLVPMAHTSNPSTTVTVISEELRDLKVLLQGMVPDPSEKDDFHWNLTSNGVFTVSSVSHLVANAKDIAWTTSIIKMLDVIWKTNIPAKTKIFSWRFLINRLPLKDQLANRGVSSLTSIDCPFCASHPESLDHLFFNCHVTKEVWNRIYMWLGNDVILSMEDFKSFGSIQEKVRNTNVKVILNTIWIALIWCIWKMRNTIIFDNDTFCFDEVISNILYFSWRWISSKELPSRLNF